MSNKFLIPSLEFMQRTKRDGLFQSYVDAFQAMFNEFNNFQGDWTTGLQRVAAKHAQSLGSKVRDDFNLKVDVILNQDLDYNTAYVLFMPPEETIVNQTLSKNLQSAQKRKQMPDIQLFKTLADNKFLTASINFDTMQASGLHELMESAIVMGPGWFMGERDADMCAALFLHEVGHVWTSFAYAGQMFRGMISMHLMGQAFLDQPPPRERRVIIESVLHSFGGEPDKMAREIDEAIQNDVTSGNPGSPEEYALVTSEFLRHMSSGHKGRTEYYTERQDEHLADEFVMSLGGGVALAKAMSTVTTSRSSVFTESTLVVMIYRIFNTAFSLAILPMNWLAMMLGFRTGFAAQDRQHGSPRERVIRAMRETTHQLKNTALPDEAVKRLLKDIADLEKEVKRHSETDWGDFTKPLAYLHPTMRSKLKFRDAMSELEDLANNPFYISAQRFRLGDK